MQRLQFGIQAVTVISAALDCFVNLTTENTLTEYFIRSCTAKIVPYNTVRGSL